MCGNKHDIKSHQPGCADKCAGNSRETCGDWNTVQLYALGSCFILFFLFLGFYLTQNLIQTYYPYQQ